MISMRKNNIEILLFRNLSACHGIHHFVTTAHTATGEDFNLSMHNGDSD